MLNVTKINKSNFSSFGVDHLAKYFFKSKTLLINLSFEKKNIL